MRMPLDHKKAADTVKGSLGLDNVIVAPVKKKTSADVEKEKKAKKKAAPRKKKA